MKQIQTENLTLRSFTLKDYPEIQVMMTNPKVMKFTGYREPKQEDFIRGELKRWIRESAYGNYYWCIQEKSTNNFVGWAMLKRTISEFLEIGFMLTQSQWNKGYATETAKSILKFAKNSLGQDKVIASRNIDNLISEKVMKKLGAVVSRDYISEPDIIYYEIDLKDY